MKFLKALALAMFIGMCSWNAQAAAKAGFYSEGVNLYNAGRFSEATEAFEKAVRQKDRSSEAQRFIDRIRKEAVERIRNRALTGVSKSTWQTKYYYIRAVGGRIRVGISYQELFERQSLNFRQGAVDALMKLADVLQHNDNAVVDLDLISEINQDIQVSPELLARQQAELFSFLSLASQDILPKY